MTTISKQDTNFFFITRWYESPFFETVTETIHAMIDFENTRKPIIIDGWQVDPGVIEYKLIVWTSLCPGSKKGTCECVEKYDSNDFV